MKNDENQTFLRAALAGIVVLHLAVVFWHGSAHSNVPVPTTTLQTAFVVIVIMLLPLVGAALLWSRFSQIGSWTVTLSMFGSLLFGVINHFVLVSSDNIAQVPQHVWHRSFVLSAYVLAATEAMGTLLDIATLVSRRRHNED